MEGGREGGESGKRVERERGKESRREREGKGRVYYHIYTQFNICRNIYNFGSLVDNL